MFTDSQKELIKRGLLSLSLQGKEYEEAGDILRVLFDEQSSNKKSWGYERCI